MTMAAVGIAVSMHHLKERAMSLSRLFAVVVVFGVVAAVALTVRAASTTPAVVALGTEHANIAERSLEFHARQAGADRSSIASASPARPNSADHSLERRDLADLQAATAQFHQTDVANAAGYSLVSGLDYCFNKVGVGGMGFHLIKTSSLDLTLNWLQPEAMVYAPGPNGQYQLGAVEYIVPAAAWDAAGHSQPPAVLEHGLHLNSALGVYVLHAWIWQENPAGMFEDWNPKVSCP
jgi:hypothetical protein